MVAKHFTYFNNTSEISSYLLLASTSSNVLLENAFNECLGVSNVFPSATYVQTWLLENEVTCTCFNMLTIACGLWLR